MPSPSQLHGACQIYGWQTKEARLRQLQDASDDLPQLLAPHLGRWQAEPRLATYFLSRLHSDAAIRLISAMRLGKVEINLFHYNALLSCLEKDGYWSRALNLLATLYTIGAGWSSLVMGLLEV
eukprot:s3526_g1.t1